MKKILLAAIFLLTITSDVIHAQTVITDSITHNSVYRKFIVNLPPSYTSISNMPLVYVLHGGGGDALGFKNKYKFDEIGDTANYITVFPYGLNSSWAVGSGYSSSDSANVDDVGFLGTLKDSLISSYSIDSMRVYVVGASKGGLMTQRLACQTPHKFAAFAAIAANMPDSALYVCNPQCPVPILVMNGTEDSLMYYYGGLGPPETDGGWIISTDSVINFWRNHNGCTTTSPNIFNFPDIQTNDSSNVIKYDYGYCNDSSEVILYKVDGGGHNVPTLSFVPLNPSPITGFTNRDIQGELEVWYFFKRHKQKCTNVVGISEINYEFSIGIFPNPFSTQTTFQTDNFLRNATLTVDNCFGQTIAQIKNISGNTVIFHRDNLPSGLYFVRLTQDNQVMTTKKLIITD